MNPRLSASLLDMGLSFLAGLFFTLYGFGAIGRKAEGESPPDPRIERMKKWFRWLGPLLMGITLLRAILKLTTEGG